MEWLTAIDNVDIYLIDQLMKGRVQPNDRILDAGCGRGRNLRLFLENGFDCVGIDPNGKAIEQLRQKYPDHQERFILSSIEDYKDADGFDFIVCNAVLHFATDHAHFDRQFTSLVGLLRPSGTLFIRMTSTVGFDVPAVSPTGVYDLPDGTRRYLITREQITDLCNRHGLQLLDPVKSTSVDNLRSMATLVFGKE